MSVGEECDDDDSPLTALLRVAAEDAGVPDQRDISANVNVPEEAQQVSEAVLAVLPDDAPAGHIAHAKVKYQAKMASPVASFVFSSLDGGRIPAQTTLGACGSREATERVARAMYLRFEEGSSKDEVLQFRKACYEKLRVALGDRPASKVATRNSADSLGMEQILKSSRGGGTSAGSCDLGDGQSPSNSLAEGVADIRLASPVASSTLVSFGLPCAPALIRSSSDGVMEEDAPPEHVAHSAVKFQPHPQGDLFAFHYNGEHFQVTVGRACNSEAQAGRIARLCYLSFEAGQSKEDVTLYRKSLLRSLSTRRSASSAGFADAAASRPAKKHAKGGLGVSWFSQLGSKHSCMKGNVDPLDDMCF